MSEEKQMLCFMSGANAIFTGEKMLTTDCNGWDEDKEMFNRWGLQPMVAKEDGWVSESGSWESTKSESSVVGTMV